MTLLEVTKVLMGIMDKDKSMANLEVAIPTNYYIHNSRNYTGVRRVLVKRLAERTTSISLTYVESYYGSANSNLKDIIILE